MNYCYSNFQEFRTVIYWESPWFGLIPETRLIADKIENWFDKLASSIQMVACQNLTNQNGKMFVYKCHQPMKKRENYIPWLRDLQYVFEQKFVGNLRDLFCFCGKKQITDSLSATPRDSTTILTTRWRKPWSIRGHTTTNYQLFVNSSMVFPKFYKRKPRLLNRLFTLKVTRFKCFGLVIETYDVIINLSILVNSIHRV